MVVPHSKLAGQLERGLPSDRYSSNGDAPGKEEEEEGGEGGEGGEGAGGAAAEFVSPVKAMKVNFRMNQLFGIFPWSVSPDFLVFR